MSPNTQSAVALGTQELVPEHRVHALEHCTQRHAWDCGVACVLMLLDARQRAYVLDNFELVCRQEGFGHSTWTIDLCYLLKRFGVRHVMYTAMLGVNRENERHGYYHRIMEMDAMRVRRRFACAAARGVAVAQRGVCSAELVRHVALRGPALVLVDAARLACDLCARSKLRTELRRCFLGSGAYRGHYIVVVGWSGGRLLYRDPALRARLCAASPRTLRAARLAPGTDQDVVLVYSDTDTRTRRSHFWKQHVHESGVSVVPPLQT